MKAAPVSAPPAFATPPDLVVVLEPNLEMAEFYGTRAMLEAEGLIPAGTEWPTGFNRLYWEDGRVEISRLIMIRTSPVAASVSGQAEP